MRDFFSKSQLPWEIFSKKGVSSLTETGNIVVDDLDLIFTVASVKHLKPGHLVTVISTN